MQHSQSKWVLQIEASTVPEDLNTVNNIEIIFYSSINTSPAGTHLKCSTGVLKSVDYNTVNH